MREWKRCYGCMEQRDDWDGQGYCPFCGFHAKNYRAGTHILPLGTGLLGGRYVIGKKLSKGGFGITYIGWDNALAHKVAIKEYYPSELVDRDTTTSNNVTVQDKQELVERERKSFLDEAKILYSLSSCKGIVQVENIIEDENDTSYIIMELLEGITLKEYRDQQPNKQMSLKETLRIMEPVIKSMEQVHKQGVIHRDISPDNIMLCNNLEVKLLDFGAARQQDRTQFTAIMKVEFAPPEQRYRKPGEDERSRSLKQQGPWTDVYALCATIYYLVAGKAAESAQARACHMLEEGQDTLVPLSQWNDDVDSYMDSVIQKGMALKIKKRYQSMEELYQAFYMTSEQERKAVLTDDYGMTEPVADVSLRGQQMDSVSAGIISEPGAAPVAGAYQESGAAGLPGQGNKFGTAGLSGQKAAATEEKRSAKKESGRKRKASLKQESLTAEQTDIQSDGQSLQARAMASGQAARSAQRELEESGKSKKSRLPLIVVICSLAVGLLVIGVWQIGRSKQSSVDNNMAKVTGTPAKQTAAAATPEPVVYKMENVIGMKKKAAEGSIDQTGCKGIRISWKKKYSSETSKGKIMTQSIDPGTEIKEGEEVTLVLVVSKGVQRFTVPKVVGNSESQARQKLKKAKMQISVAREYSSSYSSGKVISQSVAAGKKVTKGKAVTITVSRGAKPVTHTTTNTGSSTRRSTSSSGSSSGSSSKTTPKKVLPPM